MTAYSLRLDSFKRFTVVSHAVQGQTKSKGILEQSRQPVAAARGRA